MSTPPALRSTDTAFVALAGVALLAGVAGYITLKALGQETTEFVLFISPTIGALVAAATVNRRQGEVHEAVRRVEAQTNGVLDDRIARQTENSVRKVLTDAGVVTTTHQPVVVQVPPPAPPPV